VTVADSAGLGTLATLVATAYTTVPDLHFLENTATTTRLTHLQPTPHTTAQELTFIAQRMPPRRTGRAAAANTENVKVNGDVAAPKPRGKSAASCAGNRLTVAQHPGRGRPKKDVNANKDAGDKADDIRKLNCI
jgi:hypothetical protein